MILTEDGARVLNLNAQEIMDKYPLVQLKNDYKEGDVYKTELWQIMAYFGPKSCNGAPILFTNLEKE